MTLDKILNPKERNHLRDKLKELPKSELWHLCRVLSPDKINTLVKPDKESYVSILMVHGLQNPDAPNYLPSID